MNKYIKYLGYILEHKKNVFKIAWKYGLYKHAFTHDLSKFSIAEFKPYAEWFYGKYGVNCLDKETHHVQHQMAKTRFDCAWQHHKDNNKHHWDYWYERNMDMPMKYVQQMLVDWEAMSVKFGGTPKEFYNKNKNKIKFVDDDGSRATRDLLEFWLETC